MAADTGAASVPMDVWLAELLAPHRAEIRSRGLELRLEFDAGPAIEPTEALAEALRELFRLILATVPDGCEVYLAGSRPTAPVAPVGHGRLSARWQVAGLGAPEGADARVTRIHPRPGDAQRHARGSLAKRVRAAFARTDWSFELDVLGARCELLARAERG